MPEGDKASAPKETEKNIGLDRMIFFSDGVFAIAITLLVLDIQLPTGLVAADFPTQLFKLESQIGAYVLSFFVIGSYWLSHHRLYQYVTGFDNRLLWLNLLLLLFVAFIPFPTRALAGYGNVQSIIILYAATITLTGLVSLANWWYIASGYRFLEPDLDPVYIRHVYIRGVMFPVVFSLSIVVALFNPQSATYVWFLAAFLSFVTSVRFQRASHRTQE